MLEGNKQNDRVSVKRRQKYWSQLAEMEDLDAVRGGGVVYKCCLETGGECSFLFSVGLINSKSVLQIGFVIRRDREFVIKQNVPEFYFTSLEITVQLFTLMEHVHHPLASIAQN